MNNPFNLDIVSQLNTFAITSIKEANADPMERPLWEVDKRFIDPFATLPSIQMWIKMGDRAALPCQGIITFSAKPKQGKSLSTYALLIPIITGQEFDTITPTEKRARLVIVFDTEMDIPTLTNRAMIMHQALGDNAPRFQIVPLVTIPKSERTRVIEEVTEKYNPDIVIIDQAARLVANFNDAAENIAFGEWLTNYSTNRTTFVVIHQNKAADNTQMKGHLGSILEELAVENYSVSNKKGLFTISPTNARNSQVDENSACVTFALNDTGQIISATDIAAHIQAEETSQWRNDLSLIFDDKQTLHHNEIINIIVTKQGLSKSSAERKISNARQAGAIEKIDPTDKNSPYRLTH